MSEYKINKFEKSNNSDFSILFSKENEKASVKRKITYDELYKLFPEIVKIKDRDKILEFLNKNKSDIQIKKEEKDKICIIRKNHNINFSQEKKQSNLCFMNKEELDKYISSFSYYKQTFENAYKDSQKIINTLLEMKQNGQISIILSDEGNNIIDKYEAESTMSESISESTITTETKKKDNEIIIPSQEDGELLEKIDYNKIIENMNIGEVKLKLEYSSIYNSDSIDSIVKKIENLKCPLLTVIETQNNTIFGGFTKIDIKYEEKDKFIKDKDSFLYSFNKNNLKIFKIRKEYSKYAFNCSKKNCLDYGIGSDLLIKNEFLSTNKNYTELCTFSKTGEIAEYPYELNNGDKYFKVKNLEIYSCIV